MFTFMEGDKKYRVWFKHTILNEADKVVFHAKFLTNCYIEAEDKSVIRGGIASCSLKDNPCRETGRKISLGRAIKHLYPEDKVMRKAVWSAYFEKQLEDYMRGVEKAGADIVI